MTTRIWRILLPSVLLLACAVCALPQLPPATAAEKPPIDVLLLGYYIWAQPNYVELCAKEGIRLHRPKAEDPTGADPANYPVEYLKQFHVVVVSGAPERPWDPSVVRGTIKPGIIANLLEYNRQGGGVIWTPLGAGYGANSWTETIGKRIDAVALDETLSDPAKDVSVSLMQSFRDTMRYIRTNDITPHPVTDGVKGLFFGKRGEWGWPGTIPMKFGPSWNVLVRGMDTARTTLNGTPDGSGTRGHTVTDTTGTYASHPELIGVRNENGDRKGRMLVQSIYTTWTWGNYGHPAMKEAFLFNGDGIYPSDGQRFLLNAWRWLAEPAQVAGGIGGYQPPVGTVEKPVDLSPVIWQDVDWTKQQGSPEYRGLFGARSQWGGGRGTVADWAAAAKAAGLDFLVFTDDPNTHTPETYTALVTECVKQSSKTFAIVPGIGCRDANGIFRFIPGMPRLPDRKRFDAQGRMTQPGGIMSDCGWSVGQVVAEIGKLPYNPWFEHWIMACAPLTYEGTRLVDDGIMRWLRTTEPNSAMLLPLSLVRLDSPDGVAAAAKSTHCTVLRINDMADIKSCARQGCGGQVFPSYLTSGPRVPIWRIDMSPGEPFRPGSSRFRILLKAVSEVGLAEVKCIDATDGSTYRLWKPNGLKEFTAIIDETTVDQRVIGLIITDVNGRTAIAPPAYTFQGANRIWFMSDRLMGMQHTTSWDIERKRLINFGAPTVITYNKAIPSGGDEFTTEHISRLKFQGIEGSGIYPPAFKFPMVLDTDKGQEPTPGRQSTRYENRLAGHDLTVYDLVADELTVPQTKPFSCDGLPLLREETKLATIVSRAWKIRQQYMAPVVMMVNEFTITFRQDVQLKRFFLGRFFGADAPGEFNLLLIKPGANETTLTWQFEQGEKFSRYTEFTPGGYLYQAKALAGTTGFIALDDTIACQSQARVHEFVLSKKYLKAYRAGDALTLRILRVSRAYEAQQASSEWLERFTRDYGIGMPPGYRYTVTQGILRGINYVLDLDAKDGGAAIDLGKYELPDPLPVRVTGVRKNAVLGEYDLDTLRVRPLPYFAGTVTTSVETQVKATRLYVGEWLCWTNDQVRVSLVTDGTGFLLEAHNPTGTAQSCTFTGAPGFAPLTGYRKEMTLAPYSSVKERIDSLPGTVKLMPLR